MIALELVEDYCEEPLKVSTKFTRDLISRGPNSAEAISLLTGDAVIARQQLD